MRSVRELQRRAGYSAASGLIRLVLAGKGPEATSEVEGGPALHGRTTASYNGGHWRIAQQRATTHAEGCDCPPKTRCLHVTGDLASTYGVTVRIIPLDLTGCGRANLSAQVTVIDDAEAAQRQADADAVLRGKQSNDGVALT